MKRALFVLAIASFAGVVSAHAAVVAVDFAGTVVQTQGATGQSVGSTVTGHFDINSIGNSLLDFTIAGKSVAPGFASVVGIGPALTDAIYTAAVSPVTTGGTINNTFTLDLSSLTTWPSTDNAFTLLTDRTQLPSNVATAGSPFPSFFSYFTANSDGTNVVSLNANLTSITAAAVPEPASLALLGASLFGLGLLVRRRLKLA